MKGLVAIWMSIIPVLLALVMVGLALTNAAEPSLGSPKNPTEIVNPSSPILRDKSQISKKKSRKSQSISKESEKRSKESKSSNDDVSSNSSVERSTDPSDMYTAGYFMQMGEIYENGWRYTWYSENVLPGGGLDIPGRHVDGEGYVVDSEERLVAASEDIPYGTEINVPFGSGVAVVRDCGCPSGTIDIYTSW